MFIGILERKWSCHPTPPQANRHFLVDILPRIQRSLKCSDFDIVPVAKAILGREYTLPSCTREAICSEAPWVVHMTTGHCVKFCVCAVQIYAFMHLSVCVWMGVWTCLFVGVFVFLCVLILISTSAWHTDARMQSWPPALAKQCVTGQLVAQLLLRLLGVSQMQSSTIYNPHNFMRKICAFMSVWTAYNCHL